MREKKLIYHLVKIYNQCIRGMFLDPMILENKRVLYLVKCGISFLNSIRTREFDATNAGQKRVLKCYVEPVLLYGSESWNVNKQIKKSLEATEMSFLRRMLRIPWTARISNINCLEMANESRK